ncbi:MAG: hypothetical protein ACHQXJ_03445 [Nitrososphaerales archaeon]
MDALDIQNLLEKKGTLGNKPPCSANYTIQQSSPNLYGTEDFYYRVDVSLTGGFEGAGNTRDIVTPDIVNTLKKKIPSYIEIKMDTASQVNILGDREPTLEDAEDTLTMIQKILFKMFDLKKENGPKLVITKGRA